MTHGSHIPAGAKTFNIRFGESDLFSLSLFLVLLFILMIECQKLGFYPDLEQNFFLPTLLLIISFSAIVLSLHNFSKLLLDLQIPFLWYMQLKNALPSVNVRPSHNICVYHSLGLYLVLHTYTMKMLTADHFGKIISCVIGGYLCCELIIIYIVREHKRSMSLHWMSQLKKSKKTSLKISQKL